MPLLRRLKLTCFYCGRRSAKFKEAGIRCWQCENCEAENWLDENGEITEPPATSSATTRYISPQPMKPVPEVDPLKPSTGDELFCQTCQKNQHLYTQSLASFYPSPSQENFDEFARAEHEYRAGLEERYPLICEDCEPRVQACLKRVNYFAKADHMGRVKARLRDGPRNPTNSWKAWITWFAGLLWFSSWTIQIAWHILGILPVAGSEVTLSSLKQCPHHLLQHHEVIPACIELIMDRPIAYALLGGLLTLWWHPKLIEKLEKRFGRVNGLGTFYKGSVLSLAGRALAWYLIKTYGEVGTDALRAGHLVAVLTCVMLISMSYFKVTTDYSCKVSFKESPEPLIKKKNPTDTASTAINPPPMPQQPLRRGNQRINRPQPFDINCLAPKPPPPPPRLPTPPPEADYDDPNAMDWSRQKPTLTRPPLPFKPSPPRSTTTTDTPFHGRLPENIISPAHRARNPPKPQFYASGKKKKFDWSRNNIERPIHEIPHARFPEGGRMPQSRTSGHALDMWGMDKSLDVSPTSTTEEGGRGGWKYEEDGFSVFSDLSPSKRPPYDNATTTGGGVGARGQAQGAGFAEPRFFVQSETGLEGMMQRSFRIDEEPEEVREVRGRDVALAEAMERAQGRKRRMLGRCVVGIAVVLGVDALVGRGVAGVVGEVVWKGVERGFWWVVYA